MISDLVVPGLPEEHRRREGEFNKYLQDAESGAALAAHVERRCWLLDMRARSKDFAGRRRGGLLLWRRRG